MLSFRFFKIQKKHVVPKFLKIVFLDIIPKKNYYFL